MSKNLRLVPGIGRPRSRAFARNLAVAALVAGALSLAVAAGVAIAVADETQAPPPETPAVDSVVPAETPTPTPTESRPVPATPSDPFELRPARTKPAPSVEPLPPVGLPSGGEPAPTAAPPGASAATPPAPASDPGAGDSAPATPDARAPRQIKVDELPINPAEHSLRPAPIDTAIVLNLKRMEKEPERRWSLRFAVGAGDVDVGSSLARARLMERFGRFAFGSIAEDLLEGFGGFGWSDAGPTKPSSAPRVEGNVRYKLLPTVTLEAQAGRSNALTYFTQPGFRFDERNEVIDLSIGPIITLPFRLWRFGFYAGGGAGLLRGKLTSEVFVPSFGGQPVYLVSEATGNSSQYYMRAGGEAFITRFASFTIEAEYRKAEIDELKYTEETINGTTSARAINETDTPLVWTDYAFDFQNQIFGWIGDPTKPVSMDFTGVSVTAGLRYHW